LNTRLVSVIVFSTLLVSCGGSESAEPAASASVRPAAARAASEGDVDPCAVLDEEMIRAHFDVGDAELEIKPSTNTHHPLCRAFWRKPDADAREKAFQAKMTDYITAKAKGEDVEMPKLRTNNEVSLTLNMPPSESEEAAAAAFQSAMQTLERGFRDKDNPEAPPKFQYDTNPVAGVEDQASWTPGLSQLSVQSGRYLFHVTVQVGDAEENQAKAKELASEIARRLPD